MMTRRQRLATLGLVVLLALSLWLGLRPALHEPVAQSSPPAADPAPTASTAPSTNAATAPSPTVPPVVQERRKKVVDSILSSLSTSIAFYGKVVDQHGQPVADARVGYSALDKWMQPGTGYTGKSDERGLFNITGIKGAELGVRVEKKGYYFIDGKSHAAFAYGMGPDSTHLPPPTKDNPAIFVLHKMGETEPIIKQEKNIRVPRNGEAVDIRLATGKRVGMGQGDLRVETWTNDQTKDAEGHYDWRCQISVPGGGLVERKGQFDFEAPINGYQPSDEVVMPQTTERWQPQAQRDYFFKLADGRYARIQLRIIAGGDHFIVLESYLNPKSGSRNLEFDPAKVVKAGQR